MIKSELFVEGIVQSCKEIFEMMLPLRLTEKMFIKPLPFNILLESINEDVFASIGLTGANSGTISLCLSRKLALDIAGWLMDDKYTEYNFEVYESVGEILNMIAGGLKNRLSTDEQDLYDLSSPIVISGKDKNIYHSKKHEHIVTPVETDQGIFYIILALDRSHGRVMYHTRNSVEA